MSAYGGEECELRGLQQLGVGGWLSATGPLRRARLLSVVPPSVWGSEDIWDQVHVAFLPVRHS